MQCLLSKVLPAWCTDAPRKTSETHLIIWEILVDIRRESSVGLHFIQNGWGNSFAALPYSYGVTAHWQSPVLSGLCIFSYDDITTEFFSFLFIVSVPHACFVISKLSELFGLEY